MRRVLLLVFVILLGVSSAGCSSKANIVQDQKEEQQKTEPQQETVKSDEDSVADLVKSFGGKLQLVSLQAPEDILKKSMQENYGQYVSEGVLSKWISEPLRAPGRLTSSPWPDRIEISSVSKLSESEYEVTGEIIEITSAEKANGGAAAKRPITLKVSKSDNQWKITDVKLEEYAETGSIIYKNTEYNFSFTLPAGWKNYSIVNGKWEGLAFGEKEGEKTIETGPMISIRHPQWKESNPRQDIPIMIFTLDQWNQLQQDKFHIGAAPIEPTELGRSSQYVFALPARYNFAFPEGFEEVENIMSGKPLKPIPE